MQGYSASQTVSIAEAWGIAVQHFQSGQFAEAEAVCRQILAIEPRNPDGLHLMGVLASQGGRHKAAIKMLRQAIKIRDGVAHYYSSLGLALQNEGKLYDALQQYKRAVSLEAGLPEPYVNMGNILKDQGKFDEAEEQFRVAITLNPEFALAYYNFGLLLQMQGRLEEAAVQYEKTIALHPLLAPAHSNLGGVLKDLGRFQQAAFHLEQAIALNPAQAEAYNNLGNLYGDIWQFEKAVEQYDKALLLEPDNAGTRYNRGFALARLRRVDEAIDEYERSLAIFPDSPPAVSDLVHQLQHLCLWEDLPGYESRLLNMLRRHRPGVSPFGILGVPSTPADQLLCASLYAQKFRVPPRFLHERGKVRDRIRVGYLSSDLHQHATAFLMAEMLERHDHSRFEILAYSYGGDDGSDMRRRLVKACDRFVDVQQLSHIDAAKKIHDDSVDILIELKGYTGDVRPQIAAYRPAPVQASFLGYPGTMGVDYIDYIISDAFISPMDQQPFYAEKIVHLPDTYQPNDSKRHIADHIPTRAECGLPEQAFVFCCFNSTYKITPAFFDIWMRLLRDVPGSVLWLLDPYALEKDNGALDPRVRVKDNLRREAAARGVDPARLVFAPRMSLAEHLARHKVADLFLDNLPINAHTTASDALWAGLPVLTCAGTTFAGRVAGSLLTAAGLPELITSSTEEYAALALRLARDPVLLAGLRDKVAQARQSPLFDTVRFTRNIESAYAEMLRIWEDGEKPRAFSV